MSVQSSSPSRIESLLVMYARRFPIRRGKLRVINSLWRAAAGDRGTRRLAVLKHGGFKMTCDLSQMIQRQFYFFGTYFLEESLLGCWEKKARGAKVILDVGANAGIYSLVALAMQPDVIVHAFEPTPEIAAHLRETAALNGLDHLRIHESAVFSENGQANLRRFRGESGDNEGMNFISAGAGEPGVERVQTVCLDQFCRDHAIGRINLLKLDIQGHEYNALKGAERFLREGRIDTIFMELNWAANSAVECPASESIALLEKTGYKFSAAGKYMNWKTSGAWMRSLSDMIASRV